MITFKKYLIEESFILEAYGDVQKQKYVEQGIEPDTADSYIQKFDLIRKNKYKELFDNIPNVAIPTQRRNDISAYKTFSELEAVVDYVKGQRQIQPTSNIEGGDSEVKPIYEGNGLEISRGDNANQCIEIRGKWPYTWCIAAPGANNLYNTYRYKDHEPTFYFVKDKKMLPTNKYHFFVLQTIKGNNYMVTSSRNDGDQRMTWEEILNIQPKLDGLRHLFVNIPLSPKERENYNMFKNSISDADFLRLPYEDKRMFLDIVGHKEISDEKFNMLPEDLKAHYISFGLGLSMPQYESIKDNKSLMKRYKQIIERKIEKLSDEQVGDGITFKPSEYLATNSKEIITGIVRNPVNSYNFARGLGFDLNRIPKEIVNSIAQDPYGSYNFAQGLGFDLTKIPPEIVSSAKTYKDFPNDNI